MADDLVNVQSDTLSYNPFDRLPSYLQAANNHQVAAGSWTLTEALSGAAAGGTGAYVGGAIGSLVGPLGTIAGAGLGGLIGGSLAVNNGKFAAASIVSGLTSFVNTPLEIANWFGADVAQIDVGNTLTSFDSDLGAYYRQNQEAADLTGFIGGSLIPAVGSIKVYNYAGAMLKAAKGGEIGANFSAATGLLQSPMRKNLSAAIAEIGAADTPMKLLNTNVLKAFGVGLADEAAQGAVASIAVLATMHASPVINNMDAKDMAWNVLEGALLGGAIGGVLRGAQVYGNIKTGVRELKKETVPYAYGESLPDSSPTSHKILNTLNNMLEMPAPAGSTPQQLVFNAKKAADTMMAYENELRINTRALAGNDDVIGNRIADMVSATTSVEEAAAHVMGLKSASRLTVASAAEKELVAAENILLKVDVAEKMGRKTKIDPAAAITLSDNTALTYLDLISGKVSTEAPKLVSLADKLTAGEKITVAPHYINAGSQGNWKFKVGENWNGAAASAEEWEARNIWANSKNGPTITSDMTISHTDLPLLRRAYNNKELTLPNIKQADGSVLEVFSREQLLGEIEKGAIGYLDTLPKGLTTPDIAKRLDVSLDYLEGTGVDVQNPVRNLFAMRTAAEDYTARLVAAGKYNADKNGIVETFMTPQYAKLVTDTSILKDTDGNVLSGMALIKAKARLSQMGMDNAVAKVIGNDAFDSLPNFSASDMSRAIPEGGPGVSAITSANNNYGSLGSMFQQIGGATKRLTEDFHAITGDYIITPFSAMKTNARAALEWNGTQTALRATPEVYYHNPETSELVLRRVLVNEQRVAAGKKPLVANILDPKAPERIPLSDEVNMSYAAHVSRNGQRVEDLNTIKAAGGFESKRDPKGVYPLPVNQRDYPHFAFVKDDTITGTGHMSTIYAATAEDLEKLSLEVYKSNPKLTIIRKDQSEAYKKALGEFEKDDTISENVINAALHRSGVSANYVPKTDPLKIVDDAINWHLEQDRLLARYAVTSKYSKEFDELKKMGAGYAGLQTSKVGNLSLAQYVTSKVSNPMEDYINVALNMKSSNESPTWTAINNFAEQKFTQIARGIQSIWKDNYTADNATLVNAAFDKAGLNTAYYNAALLAHANHTAPVGALTSFVTRANSVLATLQLRMDPANAFVNTISSVILTSPEIRSVLDGIKKGNVDKVGDLAYMALPGTGDSILSPAKLYANSVKAFFEPGNVQWAKENGWGGKVMIDVHSIIEDIAMNGKEGVKELLSKESSFLGKTKALMSYDGFSAVGNSAERLTGNRIAEEFNRFSAAYTMKQITDEAISQGLMTESTAKSYINTFVNRTNGVTIASQRPLMFQGPVGQAIGLFQSYQFNLAQQLLRHVAEGASKDAALMIGLQSTIYGMHGLPGFDYINNHVIGTMSGNPNNRDLYNATYGIAGKTAGDWLMYGAASNSLGLISPDLSANLYSRGDLNPRNLTIIPVAPERIPIISASMKFFSNMKETSGKLAAGGDVWPTMMQGIEHSGLNRPLAGLAQTLQALGNPNMQSYSTSTKGNVTASNDLISLANLTRLAGAKPLDEAIALDAGYRLDAYKTLDSKKIKAIGEALKTTVQGGSAPSQDQIDKFTSSYVAAGGKQENFNKFMISTMKSAQTSHANQIANSLTSTHNKSMQQVMGGYELKDFSNTQ